MLKLFNEENAVKRTAKKISEIEKALVDFKQKKPLAEKALKEKQNFKFGMTFQHLSIGDEPNFKSSIYLPYSEKKSQQFQASLDEVIPFIEAKLAFLRKQLTEQEAQLEIARKALHQEEQRQADLVVYKQGELNKIELEKLRLEAEYAKQEQEQRKNRFEQLNSLGNRSENIRRELERDWQQRRGDQDSERENLYKFLFDQNDKD